MGALRKEEVEDLAGDIDDQPIVEKRYQEPASIFISDDWDTALEEYMDVYEDFVGDDFSGDNM